MYINEEGIAAATSTADMAQVTLPLGGTQKRKLALDGSGPIAKKKKKLKRFKEFIKESKVAKTINQKRMKIIAKNVRAAVGTKQGDKWDDPDKFVTSLVDAIEANDVSVNEYDIRALRDGFKNKRSDIYIDVDKGSRGLTFTDADEKEGYVSVSWYNDPGSVKDTDYRYEMVYYFN